MSSLFLTDVTADMIWPYKNQAFAIITVLLLCFMGVAQINLNASAITTTTANKGFTEVGIFSSEEELAEIFGGGSSETTTSNQTTNTSGTALVVINIVNDTMGGTIKSSDFSLMIGNLNSTRSSSGSRITNTFDYINGSESGSRIQMMPGVFFVADNRTQINPLTARYNSTFSGDCIPFVTGTGETVGVGIIFAGQIATCRIDRIILLPG